MALSELHSAGDAGAVSREKMYELLSNRRRQYVVECVSTNERLDFSELVDYVAAQENDIAEDQLESEQRKRVYTALRQAHLPKLDDADVIDFARQRGTVQAAEHTETALEYLSFTPGRERRYSYSYLGLSIGGFGIAGLHGAGIPLLGTVPTIYLVAAICFLVGFVATLHIYSISEKSTVRVRGIDVSSYMDA
jgi:hypothetical protein